MTLLRSFRACAGDIVLGMEDGIASIIGLIFGVATTGDRHAVLVAGCSACASAAVSMMAGVFMEAETELDVGQKGEPPMVRALWMLVTDFLAAALPIIPFALLPMGMARWAAGLATLGLLSGLGAWRAQLGGRPRWRTILETNLIGTTAALMGAGVGVLLAA